jgi:vitamin B12 transporter
MVVTAAAFPAQEGEISADITIITREEIERQQAVTVSEILTQVPGLHVDESGARGGLSSVYIRGGDPNFTAIMIDGVPINDPTNARGGSVDLSTLTPENIERIEIVRGPASSLYGSDPLAGVINIVTRRGDKESRYGFTLEAGSFGHARGVLGASGPAEPVNYSLSLAYRRNDEQVDRDKFRLGNIGLNLDLLKFHNFSLRWTSQYSTRSASAFPEGSGGPRFAILRDTERRDSRDLLTGLHLSHDINPQWQQNLSASIFYRTQSVDSPGVQSSPDVFAIPPANFDTTYTRSHFLWKSNYRFTTDWALAGGVQLTGEKGEREGFQDLRVLGAPDNMANDFAITRFTPAGFMETNVLATESLKATVGVRLDLPQKFDSELSPQLGLLYHASKKTKLRLNFGRAFKLPSIHALGDPLIGDRNLKPESSLGGGVGIEQFLFETGQVFKLTYFYNKFSRLIDLDPELAQQGVFKLANLSTVETQGIEANVTIRPYQSFSAKGFFTYLHSDIKDSDQPLRNRPRFSGGIVLENELFERLLVRMNFSAVGKKFDLQIPTARRSTEAYVKADLALTFAANRSWTILGVLANLTNSKYEDYVGFRAPGTNVTVGMTYRH